MAMGIIKSVVERMKPSGWKSRAWARRLTERPSRARLTPGPAEGTAPPPMIVRITPQIAMTAAVIRGKALGPTGS
jgi:hypothetical protein